MFSPRSYRQKFDSLHTPYLISIKLWLGFMEHLGGHRGTKSRACRGRQQTQYSGNYLECPISLCGWLPFGDADNTNKLFFTCERFIDANFVFGIRSIMILELCAPGDLPNVRLYCTVHRSHLQTWLRLGLDSNQDFRAEV